MAEQKRKLTKQEIAGILDFIKPNPHIPVDIATEVVEASKQEFLHGLINIKIYPSLIPKLKKKLSKTYFDSLIQPGENVGIIMAQSIGEKHTQSNLNTFHKAGSADKQPVVSEFSELLNATNKPKCPSFMIHLLSGNDTVANVRKTIGKSLVHITLKKLVKNFTVHLNKEEEPWYRAYYILTDAEKEAIFTDCISLEMNMEILYEYKISLAEVVKIIQEKYMDLYCIYSPDCYGRIDIFADMRNIEFPEEKIRMVKGDSIQEMYLEEVVQPQLQNIHIAGVPGILQIFFVKDDRTKIWHIETENFREKIVEKTKLKKSKIKPLDSIRRFKTVLALPYVNMTYTTSNNIWDMYFTLGIEAVRKNMIDRFNKIMDGINRCHIALLVDKMTGNGTVSSISRYTMRREEGGVLGKSSFEETLDNLLSAGVYGQKDNTRGVSASIICGKRARIGTGLCDLSMNLQKLLQPIPEQNEPAEQNEDNSDEEIEQERRELLSQKISHRKK